MSPKVNIFLSLIALLIITSCDNNAKTQSLSMKTVKNVDLKRYMGVWYEIARFPHSFEKGLVGVSATYTLKENGKVEVLNQGYKGTLDGKLKKAKGFAKVPNPSEPGRLMVYFFWPFGGEYLILDLDENYQHVLVGSSNLNYLWILSRNPKMEDSTYNDLVNKAKLLGFDTSKLDLVLQK
ncbi:MAG: lipocalin family protein [Tenuifilaceae bacterium]